ncbi:MAG: hypothetical protein GX456_16170 [Verrucomicrobia bacterium]|nr:hypothetical protein [Verrucomicrobiota bacterium]
MGVSRREAFGVRQLAAALFHAQTTYVEPDRRDAENAVANPETSVECNSGCL